MTQLYSLKRTKVDGEFIVTKFDSDLNPSSVYAVSKSACSGPDGHRPKCKHREMLRLFLDKGHIDDGYFLDWDTRLWRGPVADLGELADRLLLDNARESDPPLLGQTQEQAVEALAETLAPTFASEASPLAVAATSAAPATPPPPASGRTLSVGGGDPKRRRFI